MVLPSGMTAKKLRRIAGWMDTLDLILDGLKTTPELKQKLEEARGPLPHDTVQKDLRRWADEIDAASNEVKG